MHKFTRFTSPSMTVAYGPPNASEGYSALGAFRGIWDDTLMWFHAQLPSWLTGVKTVNVPATDEGEAQLREMLPTLHGKTILISASTQYLLWRIIRDELQRIDTLWQNSLDLPADIGNQMRAQLSRARAELYSISEIILNQNEQALRAGVPPANLSDWVLVELPEEQRTAFLPPWGAVVLIAVGILTVGGLIYKVFTRSDEISAYETAIKEAVRLGNPQLIQGILSRFTGAEETGWSWGWAVGLGLGAVGLSIFTAFLIGQLKKMSG